MSLDHNTVRAIAYLARIRVPDNQLDALVGELSAILRFIEQLNAVDTEGVPPMTSVADLALPMRPDEVADGGIPERILANAPQAIDGTFAVPKVVE